MNLLEKHMETKKKKRALFTVHAELFFFNTDSLKANSFTYKQNIPLNITHVD